MQLGRRGRVVRQLPLRVHGAGRRRRHARALRRPAARHRRRRRRRSTTAIDPHDYAEYIGEAVEPWSYLKSTYWKPLGYPEGIYRVGPLARLNVADTLGTPRADEELDEFRGGSAACPRSSFHYHYARLIDILYGDREDRAAAARPGHPLARVRSQAPSVNRNEGIGVAEAPRGTLIHHYKVDDDGIVAVGQPGHRHRATTTWR